MNRIILVGNGFDLAHNLRTSYKDFMDWYWSQWVYKLRTCHDRHISDGLCSFILRNENSSWSSYFFHNIRYIMSEVSDKNIIEEIRKHSICSVKFKPLMERIVKSLNINNWVDIENEYYQCLLNPKSTPIAELNKELDTIRALLIEYLTTISSPIINPQLKKFIQDPIIKEDIAVTSLAVWKDFVNERLEFDLNQWKPILYKYGMEPIYDEYDIRFASYAGIEAKDEYSFEDLDKMQKLKTSKFALLPDNIMLLNFNYTNLADQSLPDDESFSTIHIHGELTNPSSVIFGYGDEMDEGYETLKRKNDNEYLKHMKTARYLETNNYRRMLTFVESAPYQVYIMGHSCGNSDRTLLNTLFEHPNCISIKPFYYKRNDSLDNYNEIAQNISRNFTNKQSLRDKVVNKKYCKPLIQQTKKETLSSLDYYISLIKNMNIPMVGKFKAPYKPMLMLALINAVNDLHHITNEEKISLIPFELGIENYFETIWDNHRFYGLHFNYDISHVLLYMDKEPFYKLLFADKVLANDSLQAIKESYKGIILDDELIKLILNPISCDKLRETLENMLNPN